MFTVGGLDPSHGYTELMPIETWKWMPKTAYPFLPNQRSHAVVYYDGMFYVFGGSHRSAGNYIAGYHELQNYWKRLGTLNFHRNHSNSKNENNKITFLNAFRRNAKAINLGNDVLITGGLGDHKPTEKCKLDQASVVCTIQENAIGPFPELFIVNKDLC